MVKTKGLSLRGGRRPTWQSRAGSCSSYRLPIKPYKPIASVAALRERHTGWQYTLHCFYGARSPDLSLRGPIGAVAISCNSLRFRRWLSCAPDGYCEIATSGFRPPRNDRPLVFTVLLTACLLYQCSAGPGCPRPLQRAAGSPIVSHFQYALYALNLHFSPG